MERVGGVSLSGWVRERVNELWRLRFEILMEELEKSGVYDIRGDSFEELAERVVRGMKAHERAARRWMEILEKEPEEVRRAMARIIYSLLSLVYDQRL